MSFLDAAFLFGFLPLSLAFFFGASRLWGRTGGLVVLLAASLIFCLPFGAGFTTLVVLNALGDYVVCLALARGAARPGVYVVLGVLLNIGLLAVLKYNSAFAIVPHSQHVIRTLSALVPTTISFLTFQRMVLVLDSRRGERGAVSLLLPHGEPKEAQRPLPFFVFVSAFPNLVIGPIAYASEIAPQLLRRSFGRFRVVDLQVGVTLLVFGMFKKVVLADPLGDTIVNPVFDRIHRHMPVVGAEVIVAVITYTAQLYFDFSGYSDIAIGIGRMFGIRLPINFNSPLRASGITDFYKRWHITLTRIIVRFLFQPLAIWGARFSAEKRWRGLLGRIPSAWIPLLINFEIIGLWHGAAWTYVAFGLYHGVWFVLETEMRATSWWKRYHKTTSDTLQRVLGQVVTFAPLALSFALFRSRSLADFAALFGYLPRGWRELLHHGAARVINNSSYPLLFAAFAIIWLLPNCYELLRRYRPGFWTFPAPSRTPAFAFWVWQPTLFWGLVSLAAAIAVLVKLGNPAPFVYGGF